MQKGPLAYLADIFNSPVRSPCALKVIRFFVDWSSLKRPGLVRPVIFSLNIIHDKMWRNRTYLKPLRSHSATFGHFFAKTGSKNWRLIYKTTDSRMFRMRFTAGLWHRPRGSKWNFKLNPEMQKTERIFKGSTDDLEKACDSFNLFFSLAPTILHFLRSARL